VSRRLRRMSSGVIAVAAIVVGGALAGPAAAAPVTTRNACQFSYDTYWRDIDVTLDGTASTAAARRGDAVGLGGLTVSAALPTWMAEYGFRFGLLREGYNEIPATVWVAVQGTNTEEGVRVFSVDAVAHTTIAVNTAGQPQPAPIVYDIPDLPDSAWTARGGEIAFRQAPAGSLPMIPAGPGGGLVAPVGSVYIQARLGAAVLGLDCLPGGYIADGASHSNAVPAPVDTVDVPAFTCIARRPAGTNASPVDVRVERVDVPGGASGPRTVAPSVTYRIPNAYLADLRDAGLLPTGTGTFRAVVNVAIDGRGSIETRQIATAATPSSVPLQVTAGGVAVAGQAGADLTGSLPLSPTTWTPAGAAPLQLAVAPPGSLGAVAVDGPPASVVPYGAAHVWAVVTPASGPAVRLAFDCVSGDVTVANPGIAYSELGDQPGGDRGRFAISAYPLDPFAIAALDSPLPPATPAPAPAAPAAPAPPAPAAQAPVRTRTAAPPRPTLRLLRSRGKVVLRVRASFPRARAGRALVIERRVGRRTLVLARVVVPRSGRIDRRIAMKPAARAGATGLRGAARLQVRLRLPVTARATAAAGRYRVLVVPRALR